MTAIDDIRAERIKKLEILKAAGMDPYPARTARTHTLAEVRAQFDTLAASSKELTVVGRIMSLRGQGAIMFADLFDGTERLQMVLRTDEIGEPALDLFQKAVDQSDFIEVHGSVFTTQRGEKSVLAKEWRMIAKSLRPVPVEWFGIKDEDDRLRMRYLDMLLRPEVARLVTQRSAFWNAIRSYMLARGFYEVETPTLETLTGGAEARPFVTHHNALDIDVFLRISVGELWQKKLLVAGIPRTFEIGRIFRNEGMSAEHANDYTSFEFYAAYMDADKGVELLIELYRTVAQETFGTQQFVINGHQVDLAGTWERYDYCDLMDTEYGFDPRTVTLAEVLEHTGRAGITLEDGADRARAVDALWKKVRKSIGGPAILTGIPTYLEPLAKKSKQDPRVVERYQILIGGSELGKAFNELNDPIDQRERFEAQQKLRDAGDEEAQMADFEYVEAMEYGMPPAFGFGVSERFFSFLAGLPIREAQLFPLMRPK